MRHVTDGELHAYLDGALDLLPDGRGEDVREHLSSCPVCRERLQDEESVRSAALEILGDPDLESVHLPSFEELRQQAEVGGMAGEKGASPRRRSPLSGMPLAWAATVVLALGVGWMGGEIWHSYPSARTEDSSRPRVVDPDSASPALELAKFGPSVQDEVQAAQESRSSDPLVRVGQAEAEAAQQAEAGAGGQAGAEAGDAPRRAKAVPEPPASGGDTPVVSQVSEADNAPGVSRTTPGEGRAPADSASAGVDAAEASRLLAGASAGQNLNARVREQVADPEKIQEVGLPLESSFAVPGLKVLSVEWEEWIPGERALRIRQLLSMGDTLELRYLGLLMGTEPDSGQGAPRADSTRGAPVKPRPEDVGQELPLSPAVLEASLPPGWNQVEMRWGRGWLVARAPLPEEYIKALLRSLR